MLTTLVKGATLQIVLDTDRLELADGIYPPPPPPFLSGKVILTCTKSISAVDLTLNLTGSLECDATVLNLVNEVMGAGPVEPVWEPIISCDRVLWPPKAVAAAAAGTDAPLQGMGFTSYPLKHGKSPSQSSGSFHTSSTATLLNAEMTHKRKESSASQNSLHSQVSSSPSSAGSFVQASSPNHASPSQNTSSPTTFLSGILASTTELPAGRHEWPFAFHMPANLLPSCQTRHGRVTYLLKAKMKRKGLALDLHTRKPFVVVRTKSRGQGFSENLLLDRTSTFSGNVTTPSVAFCDDQNMRLTLNMTLLNPDKVREVRSIKVYVKEICTFCYDGKTFSDQNVLGHATYWKPPPVDGRENIESPFALAKSLQHRGGQRRNVFKLNSLPLTVDTTGASMDMRTSYMRISHVLRIKIDYEPSPWCLPGSTAANSTAGAGANSKERRSEICVLQIPLSMAWASSRRPQSWREGLPERGASLDEGIGRPLSPRLRKSSDPVELISRKTSGNSGGTATGVARKAAESSPARLDEAGERGSQATELSTPDSFFPLSASVPNSMLKDLPPVPLGDDPSSPKIPAKNRVFNHSRSRSSNTADDMRRVAGSSHNRSGSSDPFVRTASLRSSMHSISRESITYSRDSSLDAASGHWSLDDGGVYTFQDEEIEYHGDTSRDSLTQAIQEFNSLNAVENHYMIGQNGGPGAEIEKADRVGGLAGYKKHRHRSSAGIFASHSRAGASREFDYAYNRSVVPNPLDGTQPGGGSRNKMPTDEVALSAKLRELTTGNGQPSDSPIASTVRSSGAWELDGDGVYDYT
ncbi:hypothetical protein DFS34DRAFT_55303 [Phlyctochytrium arcticum]|nr:hypothetical protein DFS34DRAFT_55303 [Phlyctochytrium arcticum]